MIPLNIVSSYEFFNSLCKPEKTLTYFKEKNINTIGIVEKNTLFYVPEITKLAKKYSMKVIYGFSFDVKLDDIYTLIMYARNDNGYLNLVNLSNLINIDNIEFNYDNLKKYSYLFKNCFTVLKMNNLIELSNIHDKLVSIVGNYFVGINDNCLINEEEIKKYNLHTLYIPSINYLEKQEYKSFEVLKKLNNEDSYEHNYYNEEIINYNDSSVKNCYVLADNCNVSFNFKVSMPKYDNDSKGLIRKLCLESLSNKKLNNSKYLDRLNYELSVIDKMNFNDYFLIIYDFVKYSNEHNITIGPGRGSGASSLIAYLLNITKIDPLKYDLMFERFLNPKRNSLPDLDLDIEVKNRDKVIEYIKNKYGNDCVIGVDSFSRFKTKSTIEAIGNILNINPNMITRIKKVTNNNSILDNYLNNPEFKNIIDSDPMYKELYSHCIEIEDLPSSIIAHPSGIAINDKPFKEMIPLVKVGNNIVSQIDKNYIEDFNIIKIDLLNLDTLDIISSVVDKVKRVNPKFNIDNIELDNPKVYETINLLYTSNVFQLSSRSASKIINIIKPSKFNDIVLVNALNRPGPNLDEFSNNYHSKNINIDSRLKDILQETSGIILYQEQVLKIVMRMLKVDIGVADKYRSAIKHKDGSILNNYKSEFFELASKNGYDEKTINDIFEALRRYCGYGFNKAHAVSYSLLSYQMAYLKTIYPTFFYSTILDLHISDIGLYLKELNYFNIKLIKDINYADKMYRFNSNSLFLPISLIKNISYIDEIIEDRNLNGLYKNYLDCCIRLFKLKLSINEIEKLIYAGYMDCFKMNRNIMLSNLDNINKTYLIYEDDILIDETYQDLDSRVKYLKEIELLGFSSISFLDNYLKINNLKPLSAQLNNVNINSIGIIKDIRNIRTKNNKEVTFVDIIDDETNIINTILFENSDVAKLKINDIVKFRANISKDRNDYILRYVEVL